MKHRIYVGTRGSKLAVIQAGSVLTKLCSIAPEIDFSLVKIKTRGDRATNIPLNKIAGEGVFVKELEDALINGNIDMAIHSLKDMPVEIPDGLLLAAVTERLDPRDAFISSRGKLSELTPGCIIGTGSIRRAAQVLAYRPDLKIKDLRGNIETRLRKINDGEYDGIIVAVAALARLGLEKNITEYLPLENFTPEVGQGTLGIEIRSENKEIGTILSYLNHMPTWQCTLAERSFLKALGGGCRAPITALGSNKGNTMTLDGMIAGVKSHKTIHSTIEGDITQFGNLGINLAKKMIDLNALALIREAEDYY